MVKKAWLNRILLLVMLSALLLTAVGCGEQPTDKRVVASYEKIEFTYDEFRYFFLNCKNELDGGDESVWKDNDELKKQLQENILYSMKRVCAIRMLADTYKIKMSSDDKKIVSDYIQALKDSCASEEAYLQQLDAKYLSEYAFRQVLNAQYLLELVQEYVEDEQNFLIRADDQTLNENLETKFWCGAQILIRNEEGEDPEANRLIAEQALDKLKNGADFFDLIAEYGEDPGLRDNPDGYYFTEGERLAYFEEAVRGLEIGEYTEVVECVHGYAIITRLPMEETYIKKHYEELRASLKTRLFLEFLESKISEIQMTTTTLFYECTVDNMA